MKRGKMTEYGEQLREKQRLRRITASLKRNSKYFKAAERSKGNTAKSSSPTSNVVLTMSFTALGLPFLGPKLVK